MTRFAILFAAVVITISIQSCDEVDYDVKNNVIHDSIANVIPNWQSFRIKESDMNTHMRIVVGDPSLYKASDEVKSKKASDVAAMVLRICGKNNHLEKGVLVLTTDINNKVDTPSDAINIPMDFESIKKSQGN